MSAFLTVSMPVFRSLALGAVLVVAMAVLASLTLVPALLGLLGDRVNALRMPLLARFAGADFRRGFWDWVARVVMRCPILGLGMAVALLVALAAPCRQLETGFNGASTLPSKQAFSPWPATSPPAWCSRPRWSSTVICLPPRPR
jgi:RND superfamily putative drug exporter